MSNYKRGEMVWVLHNPNRNSDEQKIINVKVYSGESYAGYHSREIGYKYEGEKKTVNTDYVAYSRDELIERLVKQQKDIEAKRVDGLNRQIEKLSKEVQEIQKLCVWWIDFYEKQKEEQA